MTAMKKTDVLGLLQEHGSIMSGHFQLASGLHSPVYLQTALVLQYPHVAQRIAKTLATKFPAQVDVVITPGVGSVILGQEIARLKKCRAIFTERTNGVLGLRRDFRLDHGERALLVQDVLNTGRLTSEVISLVVAYGARVTGVAAIVDRSLQPLALTVPVRTLVTYPLQVSPPDTCAQCATGVPLIDATKKMATGLSEGE